MRHQRSLVIVSLHMNVPLHQVVSLQCDCFHSLHSDCVPEKATWPWGGTLANRFAGILIHRFHSHVAPEVWDRLHVWKGCMCTYRLNTLLTPPPWTLIIIQMKCKVWTFTQQIYLNTLFPIQRCNAFQSILNHVCFTTRVTSVFLEVPVSGVLVFLASLQI